jgi:hypothetical protein
MFNGLVSFRIYSVLEQTRVQGVLGSGGMLQAMLQIMFQGVGPVGYYKKREYSAFCLQGVLLLRVLKGRCGYLSSGSLTVSLLVFLFLHVLVLGILVSGVLVPGCYYSWYFRSSMLIPERFRF